MLLSLYIYLYLLATSLQRVKNSIFGFPGNIKLETLQLPCCLVHAFVHLYVNTLPSAWRLKCQRVRLIMT